jgi:hypothetical protein
MADDHATGELIRRLLTTPPGDFVAARNQAAKELRAAGDKETAKRVGALRRPNVADWVFNVLAAEASTEVDTFADAADTVRDAQEAAIEGRAGADVRESMRLLRQRTAALVAAARPVLSQPGLPVAGSSVGELTARLTEVAGSAAATEHLRHGLLAAADSGAGDLFDGLALPPRATAKSAGGKAPKAAKKSAPSKKAGGATKRSDRATEEDEEEEEEAEEEEARAAARRERVRALADAERAHSRAVKALDRAGADVDRHSTAVAKAQAAADEAIAKLDAARTSLDAAEDARDEAAAAVGTAESVLSDAKAAVDSDRL